MLALIAGRGALPAVVAASQRRAPLICALDGFLPDGLEPEITFRLETLGSFLLELGERGITEICLCGSIDRPVIEPALLDAETAPLVPILQEALSKGDDGALRAVMGLLERTGFTLRGAHELAPDLLPPSGVLSQKQPDHSHRYDAKEAGKVLRDMGAADLGQACVIRKGKVLAREDEAGTDAMLARLGLPSHGALDGEPAQWAQGLAREVHNAPGIGGILFKAPKPEQDRRADLPTIGPGTAKGAALAGLDGIVIEAGDVMVLDLPQVIAILDAMEMFLWVR